jgi:hypothetical protein
MLNSEEKTGDEPNELLRMRSVGVRGRRRGARYSWEKWTLGALGQKFLREVFDHSSAVKEFRGGDGRFVGVQKTLEQATPCGGLEVHDVYRWSAMA